MNAGCPLDAPPLVDVLPLSTARLQPQALPVALDEGRVAVVGTSSVAVGRKAESRLLHPLHSSLPSTIAPSRRSIA